MSAAQVTEEHRELARTIRLHLTLRQAYQLIADSEAKACAELRADRDYNHECINRLASATGTLGEKSERVVEVALSTIDQLRPELKKAIARAERAEAEVKKLTGFYNEIVVECGHDRIVREYRQRGELLRDEANRRKEAEAELAGIRALANRRNKRDHSQDTTHQLVAALDQALDIAQAELAATKSTLDEEVNCAEKAEHEVVRQYARAERAEADADSTRERALTLANSLDEAQAELVAERAKVRVLHRALQNLVDEQNDAPLETRREQWQMAMDEAGLALAATEGTK